MLERAIESWLTNTNERNFQFPLTQVLIRKGHRPLYISAHRPMEQGKDIITQDERGDYHALQLKTGNIDIGSFRRMRPEIVELIELPIVHPSIDRSKRHTPYLVTNGNLSDEARIQIDLMNHDNERRGYPALQVIEGPRLLAEFLEAQGNFLPTGLRDVRIFLELFGADGKELPDKTKYFAFLNGALFHEIPPQASDKRNLILASVILMSYLTNSLQQAGNHYGLFEAWTCLAACLVRFSRRAGLERHQVAGSLDLVKAAIVEHLVDLRNEVMGRTNFLEGDTRGDGSNVYRARTTMILGVLSLLEMYRMSNEDNYTGDQRVWDFIFRNGDSTWFWGESAWPFFYWLIRLIERVSTEYGHILLESLLGALAIANRSGSRNAFASPYISVTDILESVMRLADEPLDLGSFSGQSFVLESAVAMFARRGQRQILEKHWRGVSHIRFRDFQPDPEYEFFNWRSSSGIQITKVPPPTQSWQSLVQEANASEAPAICEEFLDILPFAAMVAPHRMRPGVVRLFDRSF